jgi:hypothetical protein
MMKSLGWILLIGLVTFVGLSEVSAHTLKTDGPIGAVLHVDPEDDPIAGQPAYFYFEFVDRSGQFQPSQCDCTAVVRRGAEEIYRQPLFSGTETNLTSPSFSFTFPERGIYQVGVTGQPSGGNTFSAFNLDFDVRVARDDALASPGSWPLALHHTVFLVAGLIFLVAIAIDLYLRHKHHPRTATIPTATDEVTTPS